MKFITATILYALLAFAAGLFFPWWIIAVTSFIVGLLVHQRALIAYASAFTGLSLLWTGMALWIDFQNNHVLAAKIANVLPLGGSSAYLIGLTALVGGLVSAFAAMSASYLRPVKQKEKVVVQKEEAAFVS
jgi:hypothetical protein